MKHEPSVELTRTPADLSKFWVVTVISNPVRYKRRYELYWRFAEMCKHAGVRLITVEQAFGERPFMVTHASNPHHLQVRSVEELWHKENMINLGVRHACALAQSTGQQVREIAWVDADCRPAMPYREWFEETWHQLQHHQFVQMWEYLIDLDIRHNPIGVPNRGFMANYIHYGDPNVYENRKILVPDEEYEYNQKAIVSWGAPGLAWAANIEAFNQIGGLMDFSILGANDWYFAHCLVGSMTMNKVDYGGSRYLEKMFYYQELCERWIKRDVGYVPGIVYHDFHGKKANRFYSTRGKILVVCGYNPDRDLKYDAQGLLQLETWEPRQIVLRDKIRGYFRRRNEDGTEV